LDPHALSEERFRQPQCSRAAAGLQLLYLRQAFSSLTGKSAIRNSNLRENSSLYKSDKIYFKNISNGNFKTLSSKSIPIVNDNP
jgi:hypothetical protein